MKGLPIFVLDWLVEKTVTWLRRPPTSLEKTVIDKNAKKWSFTIASAMDMEIIYDRVTNVIKASEILGVIWNTEPCYSKTLQVVQPENRGKKRPNLVNGKKISRMWTPEHRHVSHALLACSPGRQLLSAHRDPVLGDGLPERPLEMRG
jgi:alpha-L-fucosidase 2